jgi:hypothetical protein
MDYYSKYLKYKNKYISLKEKEDISNGSNGINLSTAPYFEDIHGGSKNKKGSRKSRRNNHSLGALRLKAGRSNNAYVAGINFEGGKIINHIKQYEQCVAYANCQIAMDAPYHEVPRVADESVRSSGRSESQFRGYDEEELKRKLEEILNLIKGKFPDPKIKLVIQIARGRSSEPTFQEVIKPVLDKLNITNVITKYGYRSTDYYVPSNDTPFVFLNYGMFAELSENISIQVGEICNPVVTYDVTNYDSDRGFTFGNRQSFEADEKNILNEIDSIKKLTLFGIADQMKFITPVEYTKEHVIGMIDSV